MFSFKKGVSSNLGKVDKDKSHNSVIGYQHHDLIPYSVTLSQHWDNLSSPYLNNAECLTRKQHLSILKFLVWLNKGFRWWGSDSLISKNRRHALFIWFSRLIVMYNCPSIESSPLAILMSSDVPEKSCTNSAFWSAVVAESVIMLASYVTHPTDTYTHPAGDSNDSRVKPMTQFILVAI